MAPLLPSLACEDLLVTLGAAGPISTVPWPLFTRQLFFPQVPTACRAAGNASHTAGQVGLALGAMEPGKD